jgi:transcriptional regulator with XRE-family HTH domain
VESDDFVWTAATGALLKRTRRRIGLKQQTVALQLIGLGAPATTNQSTVSKWERGTEPSSFAAVKAIHAFLAQHPPAEDASGTEAAEAPTTDAAEPIDFFRDALGEPMLGPIQLEIVRAQIKRHADGPPLTEEDFESLNQLRELYRLNR